MSGIFGSAPSVSTPPPPPAPGAVYGNGLISGGAVFRVGTTGLNFTITAATYLINSVQLVSPATNLNLAAADATNPRIDVFAVNSSGAAVVITGTPAASPVVPSLDPLSQLQVGMILVKATQTNADVTSTFMYQENVEWTSSVSGAINAAATTAPYGGTKCITATAAAAGAYFNLANGAVFDTSTRNMLFMQIKSVVWPGSKSVVLQYYSGANARGTPVTLKNGAYNLDTSILTGYQLIGIPISAFGVNGVAIDSFRGTVTGGGGALSFQIDDIIMQGGMAPISPVDAMRWKGPYNATAQYILNDVVSYGGRNYLSSSVVAGVAPPASPWVDQEPEAVLVLTDAATINWDAAASQIAEVTVAGARAVANPTNVVNGRTYNLVINQGGGGSISSWGSNFRWPNDVVPTTTATLGKTDIASFVARAGVLYGVMQAGFGPPPPALVASTTFATGGAGNMTFVVPVSAGNLIVVGGGGGDALVSINDTASNAYSVLTLTTQTVNHNSRIGYCLSALTTGTITITGVIGSGGSVGRLGWVMVFSNANAYDSVDVGVSNGSNPFTTPAYTTSAKGLVIMNLYNTGGTPVANGVSGGTPPFIEVFNNITASAMQLSALYRLTTAAEVAQTHQIANAASNHLVRIAAFK